MDCSDGRLPLSGVTVVSRARVECYEKRRAIRRALGGLCSAKRTG
jgi:hypothetical protein